MNAVEKGGKVKLQALKKQYEEYGGDSFKEQAKPLLKKAVL